MHESTVSFAHQVELPVDPGLILLVQRRRHRAHVLVRLHLPVKHLTVAFVATLEEVMDTEVCLAEGVGGLLQ